jgi:alkanesulfonate monooxygenase SsuD/methylene tetrahydromethanopterin reductase-like flavin-dependent oxidoreductase (luciferase family)
MSVRVGFLAPQFGADPSDSLHCAEVADRGGLDVWLAGQMMPMPASNAQTALEPLSLMGAIAARTTRARLGFMALAAPYLSPLYLAKALLTLDEISGGRIEAGIGAGWREEEFEALGIGFGKFSERLAWLEEALDAMEELSGPAVPEDQRRWPADARAGSTRERPPVWIAGAGPKVLKLAARRGDWPYFAKGITVEDFAAKAGEVEAAAETGRPAPRLSLTATFMAGEGDDLQARLTERADARGITAEDYTKRLRDSNVFVGSPGEIAGQMEVFVDAGCEAFVLWPLDGRHRLAVEELVEAASILNR